MNTKLLISFFLLFISVIGISQNNLSVASFKLLPNDMDARIKFPKTDQNGDKCAIIKIITSKSDFSFDGGMLGIVAVEKKVGEYWVYVPQKAKKITIKHNTLGVLRDYLYPEKIDEACTYEMVLLNAEITTKIKKNEIQTTWVLITSNPAGADIYIDDNYIGQSPQQHKVTLGEHNYQLTKYLYKPKAGKFDVTNTEKYPLPVTLDADFGSIEVNSTPEKGAEIILNGKATGKTTPATLDTIMNGEYTISLRKNLYAPYTDRIRVESGKKTELSAELKPAYGTVEIKTKPNTKIFIDNKEYGTETTTARLSPGIHNIRVENEKKHKDQKVVEVSTGTSQTVTLTPFAEYGKLDISSEPWDATIFIDGKEVGKTPLILPEMVSGKYELKLKKDGYDDIIKSIQIQPDQTTLLNEIFTVHQAEVATENVGENENKTEVQETANEEESISEDNNEESTNSYKSKDTRKKPSLNNLLQKGEDFLAAPKVKSSK